MAFEDIFVGKFPAFEVSLGTSKPSNSKARRSQNESGEKSNRKGSPSKVREELKSSPNGSKGKAAGKTSADGKKGSPKKNEQKLKK